MTNKRQLLPKAIIPNVCWSCENRTEELHPEMAKLRNGKTTKIWLCITCWDIFHAETDEAD